MTAIDTDVSQGAPQNMPRIGDPAPAFTATTTQGTSASRPTMRAGG